MAGRRTIKTPAGYSQTPTGRVGSFEKVYRGIIKDTTDYYKMGRLKVWIPDFGSNPSDARQWMSVQYCSPFAGATSIKNNTKDGTTADTTQKSYGWWAVPPDVENEVVVMFLNGDPNQGIYIGCLYQQNMNHMVPGMPSNTSFQGNDPKTGAKPPVAEYNRYSDSATASDTQSRPRMDTLHNGLTNQGLYSDSQRGPSTAGARRGDVSNAYGLLTPSGHQMVFDDDASNSYIRLRTPSGAQILVNDTAGYVYFISANGNSWYEISDEGIDGYSSASISFRAGVDINFHAENNINLFAGEQINMYSTNSVNIQTNELDIISFTKANITALDSINLTSTLSSISLSSLTSTNITAGSNVSISASTQLGLNTSGTLVLKSSTTLVNSVTPIPPLVPTQASIGQPVFVSDTTTSGSSTQTQSIVSRLPSHEPYSGHPFTSSQAASSASSNSSSSSTTNSSASASAGSTSSNSTNNSNSNSGSSNTSSTPNPVHSTGLGSPATSGPNSNISSVNTPLSYSSTGLSGVTVAIPDSASNSTGASNVTSGLNLAGALEATSVVSALSASLINLVNPTSSNSTITATVPNIFVSPITGSVFYTYYTTVNGSQNNGVNILAANGSSVVSMASGTVTKYGYDSIYGNYMIVSHDNSYESKYCYLSGQISQVGDAVSSGQTIATSGLDPVNSIGQLHFELKLSGTNIDPSTVMGNISIGSQLTAGTS